MLRIHFDNGRGYKDPHLVIWYNHNRWEGVSIIPPAEYDDFGPYYDISIRPSSFDFKFHDGATEIYREDLSLTRHYGRHLGEEVWCRVGISEIYPVEPAKPVGHINEFYRSILHLIPEDLYIPDTDVSLTKRQMSGELSLDYKREGNNSFIIKSFLGPVFLKDGSTLFGLFHPRAGRVYLTGNFNNWQYPGIEGSDPASFIEMDLYRGYYDQPNIWVARTNLPDADDPERNLYRFFVVGGVPLSENLSPQRLIHDPYTRQYSMDYNKNHCQLVNPRRYKWKDAKWKTPDPKDLILYELSVFGFTEGDPWTPEDLAGTFKGLTKRINDGYFDRLGVTALALMPTSESPSFQGPHSLGYDPATFMAIERDFGSPYDFMELVDTAHNHNLAVIVDAVFNHTSNTFNPLWDLIADGTEGGLYFNGKTPWGNRVATEVEEVQNMLIDTCKVLISEYHVDGFRFDATHTDYMDHSLLHRLAYEIKTKGFKADCILIAENLPNQQDLNLNGYDGFAQWCDPFHDKIKALLREGIFQDWTDNSVNNLGSIFYFAKDFYAAHTNNVVNYCESHDENSVPMEVETRGDGLITEPAKIRKARLGLMATIVALGQPMIYMGQEFGVDRPRNRVRFKWPNDPPSHPFFIWASRLISLRKKYPGLRISGYDPILEGRFEWAVAPWMAPRFGISDKAVIGWRSIPEPGNPEGQMLVLLNFEPYDLTIDIKIGASGRWVKLADIDQVNDLPPNGSKNPDDHDTLNVAGEVFSNFTMPSSSGFIYTYGGT